MNTIQKEHKRSRIHNQFAFFNQGGKPNKQVEPLTLPPLTPIHVKKSNSIRLAKIDYSTIKSGRVLSKNPTTVVYRSFHTKYKIVIKIFFPVDVSAKSPAQFKQEIRSLSELNTDHLVQMYAYSYSTTYCIAMEYMSHGSLYTVLQNPKVLLGWEARYRLMYDIASGLACLHAHDILHRHLTSQQVLLGERYTAKLNLFNTSRFFSNSIHDTWEQMIEDERRDCLAWTAPELYQFQQATTKSDLYALGTLFWEIATRRKPYEGMEPEAIRIRVCSDEKESIPADCPSKVASLINVCWEEKPINRPTADEVVDYLASVANNFLEFKENAKNCLIKNFK